MNKHNENEKIEAPRSTWKNNDKLKRFGIVAGVAASSAAVAGTIAIGLNASPAANKPPTPSPENTSQTTPPQTEMPGFVLTEIPTPTETAISEAPQPSATPDSDPVPTGESKDKGPKKNNDNDPVDLSNDMDIITLDEDDLKPTETAKPEPTPAPTAELDPEELTQ